MEKIVTQKKEADALHCQQDNPISADKNNVNTDADGGYRKILDGFLYTHARMGESTRQILESSAFLYALVEMLEERGLISVDDLDQRKNIVANRLIEKNREKGLGVVIQDPELDKYAFDDVATINCTDRIEYCHAACCKLPFALSRQDIREGVVSWDLGQPYMIEQSECGYCTHLEMHSSSCLIHEQRPIPCRAYDCRKDNNIWLDFEKFIINPDILSEEWPKSKNN
jgi:hypothetical protein